MVAHLLILMGLEYVTGVVTFYQFILEEAIQGGCMACYIGQKYDRIDRMNPVIERLEDHTIPALENFNGSWGYIAIWNQGAFAAFVKASKLAVRAYKECRKETTPYFPPSLSPDSPVKFTSRITRVPTPAYCNDSVTFSINLSAVKDSPEPTEKVDFAWMIDGNEVGREKKAGPSNLVESEIRMNHTFKSKGKYKIECVVCAKDFEGCFPWDKAAYTLNVKPPEAAVSFTTRILRDPVPASTLDLVTFTVKFACSIDYPEPTELMNFVWTIDNTEVKTVKLAAQANKEETEISIEKTWNEPGEHKIKCVCTYLYDEELHTIDEAAYTIKIAAPE